MFKKLTSTILLVAAVAGFQTAHAVPITYFGENLTPGGVVSGAPVTARNDFVNALTAGVSTEDFESYATGTGTPLNLTFTGGLGTINATLNGAGGVSADPNCCGRFATSGSKFWEVGSGQGFSIDFGSEVAALGFYGTDIGDFSGQVTLGLTNGGTSVLDIPHTIGANNGSLLFFGVIETAGFTSMTFSNTGSGSDFFGFDDLIVGDIAQVLPVPEPSILLLIATGLFGIGFVGRKRKV